VQSFLSVSDEAANLKKSADRKFPVQTGDELWRITAQVAMMSNIDYATICGDSKQAGLMNTIARSELKYLAGADHVITGMVPLFLQTQKAVLKSLIYSFMLACGIISIIMMVLMKKPIAGLMVMLPNVMPIGIVFGIISWKGIAVDIGMMITASVALGIAVDGSLHLLTWFRAGIEAGFSRQKAVSRSLVHCGPAMWQTSCVVGVGLLMLYPAELMIAHRFSWLMASLMGTSFLANTLFLPALLAGPLGTSIEKSVYDKLALSNLRADDPTVEGDAEPIVDPEADTYSPNRTSSESPAVQKKSNYLKLQRRESSLVQLRSPAFSKCRASGLALCVCCQFSQSYRAQQTAFDIGELIVGWPLCRR